MLTNGSVAGGGVESLGSVAQQVGLVGAGAAGLGLAKGLKDLAKIRMSNSWHWCGSLLTIGLSTVGEALGQASRTLGVSEQLLLQHINLDKLLPFLLQMVRLVLRHC